MEDTKEILRRIRRLELRTRARVEAAFSGQYRSVFKGRGMNFEEVREYQAGDEVRFIEWNVTARLGEVRGEAYVKKFTEERELSVMLLVDISGSGDFGSVDRNKRELAAEVACVLAFSAIRNNDRVGLLLFSDHVELFVPPRRGRRHALRVVREILFFEAKGRGTDVGGALEKFNRLLQRRSVVFLFSDFQAPAFGKQLGGRSKSSTDCCTGAASCFSLATFRRPPSANSWGSPPAGTIWSRFPSWILARKTSRTWAPSVWRTRKRDNSLKLRLVPNRCGRHSPRRYAPVRKRFPWNCARPGWTG